MFPAEIPPASRRAFLRALAAFFVASHFASQALAAAPKAAPKPGMRVDPRHLPPPVSAPVAPGIPCTDEPPFSTTASVPNGATRNNFLIIYGNPALAADFKNFLVNVYHLYPEEKFHALIQSVVAAHPLTGGTAASNESDEPVYIDLQAKIPGIKPFLSELTYALPALSKQKEEMSRQTAQLLGTSPVNGYVEIGTPGRYVKHLRNALPLNGPVHLVHDHEPGMNPVDIAERGGLSRQGAYVPLDNYGTWATSGDHGIPDGSVDVVSNFIGIHHSPRERVDGFVKNIHRVLRKGGKFILRDHDAHSPEMVAMVALAHDVYNAGLGLPWGDNHSELRYFKSLHQIQSYLAHFGFVRTGETLYQSGDPSKNALMLFVKN